MSGFDPGRFDEKYLHYFEELEAAYSNAFDRLHGTYNSELLRAVDKQILSESEPMYAGDGEFEIELPADVDDRIAAISTDEEAVQAVLDAYVDALEEELVVQFELD